MVKKFKIVNRKEDRDDLINEEDLSDLEIDKQEKNSEEEINDVEALNAITARMKEDFHKFMKSKNVDWLETMDLTADQGINPDLNVDDDIRRELIFYNISLKKRCERNKQIERKKSEIK